MAAKLGFFITLLILSLRCRAYCNEEDVIEYLNALKRTCDEAERLWMTMDINLIGYIHRKLQDHLNELVYIAACSKDFEELSEMIQALYNGVLRIFRHYSSILDRVEPNEGILSPPVERTGRPGRPRYGRMGGGGRGSWAIRRQVTCHKCCIRRKIVPISISCTL